MLLDDRLGIQTVLSLYGRGTVSLYLMHVYAASCFPWSLIAELMSVLTILMLHCISKAVALLCLGPFFVPISIHQDSGIILSRD